MPERRELGYHFAALQPVSVIVGMAALSALYVTLYVPRLKARAAAAAAPRERRRPRTPDLAADGSAAEKPLNAHQEDQG
jgi:hypothetical protein